MASTFAAAQRQGSGNGPARRLRSQGKIPGIIYGHGKENVQIELNSRDFGKFLAKLKSESELVSLDLGEAGSHLALIKDLQYHPVSEAILHVDFFEINPDEELHVTVPIHFVGTPVGVFDEGGMLEYLQRTLEVVCLPRNLPTAIDIDITGLHADTALHVSDLQLPEGVRTRVDGKQVIVHVTTKNQREEAAADAAAPGAAPAG